MQNPPKPLDEGARLKDIFPEAQPQAVPTTPDPKTAEEIEDLTQQQTSAEVERYKQDTGERKRYANRVFCLVTGWVIAMFVVLLLQGFGWFGWTPLADSVLGILVGGSTTSILGILYAVVSNLFKAQ